jgi:hypothetical protein
VWVIFGIVALLGLNLNAAAVCFVGLVLSGTNLYGYVKCARDHKAQAKAFLARKAVDNLSAEQINKLGVEAAK